MIHVILSKDHISIVEACNRDEAERNFNANWCLPVWFEDGTFGHFNSNGMYPEPQYYIATPIIKDNGDRAIVQYGSLENVRHEELRFLTAAKLKRIHKEAMWQINYEVSHGMMPYSIGDVVIEKEE